MRVLGFDFSNVVAFRDRLGRLIFSCVNCGTLVASNVAPLASLPLCVRCNLDASVELLGDCGERAPRSEAQ